MKAFYMPSHQINIEHKNLLKRYIIDPPRPTSSVRAMPNPAIEELIRPISLNNFRAICGHRNQHKRIFLEDFKNKILAELQGNRRSQYDIVPTQDVINAIALEMYEESFPEHFLIPTQLTGAQAMANEAGITVYHNEPYINVSAKGGSPLGDKLHISIDDSRTDNIDAAWNVLVVLAEKHKVDFKVLSRPSSEDEKGRQFTVYLQNQTQEQALAFIEELEQSLMLKNINPDIRGLPPDCKRIPGSVYTTFRNDHYRSARNSYIQHAEPGYLSRDLMECVTEVLKGSISLDHPQINRHLAERYTFNDPSYPNRYDIETFNLEKAVEAVASWSSVPKFKVFLAVFK
jgi:hypothetical protein